MRRRRRGKDVGLIFSVMVIKTPLSFMLKRRVELNETRLICSKIKDGMPQTTAENIKKVVMDFYSDLFHSSRGPIGLDEVDMEVPRLDLNMVAGLNQPYSRDEVIRALKEMHPCNSPGPDGLPALFYKQLWHLVGDEICSIVLAFLNDGHMPADLNHTFVVLIPKVRKPVEMKELRPISLCNVTYKLISKVLANRLKNILPTIINESQSAFVPGRLITDNVIVSSEIFHYIIGFR